MAINPQEFGIIVVGLLTGSQETKKGGHILSVSLGDSMVKVHSKENGIRFGEVYKARCSAGDGGLFFERERLQPVAAAK